MKVLGIHILHKFKSKHADARSQLDTWLLESKEAVWLVFTDVSRRYPSANFIQPDSIVFNIKGNKYRLWVRINYEMQLIMIEKLGTHSDYERWRIK